MGNTLVYNRFLAGHMTSVSIGFSSDRFNELSDVVLSSHTLGSRCATNRYFQVLGNVHDIESYFGIDNAVSLTAQIVLCHWGHTSIILLWASGNLFHVGWMGNYHLFTGNPIKTQPIAHGIFDPHFGLQAKLPLSSIPESAPTPTTIAYSGIYNSLYTLGFTSVAHIYNLSITCELLAVISILLATRPSRYPLLVLHRFRFAICEAPASAQIEIIRFYKKLNAAHIKPVGIDVRNTVIGFNLRFVGFLSIGWCGHLLHRTQIPLGLAPKSLPEPTLTFFGGLKPDTMSLYLTDIAHHHLAVGVLFIVLTDLYCAVAPNWWPLPESAQKHKTLTGLALNQLHLQLSLACAVAGYMASVVSQHTYSLLPYQYLSYDYVTTLALYVHHQYIASFLMMAFMSHMGIYLITTYYVARPAISTVFSSYASSIRPLVAHLSWISLYLGFHSLLLYIHNDTVVAFGSSCKQILIEPVFASIIQESSSSIMPLGPGDQIVHHAIALGIHVTVLILFKASLHASGSHLMPDKINFAMSFACDGPTRGGTCDISAWDSLYLALFWMLNTDAWIMFYFHWKHLSLWLHQSAVSQFDESSTYLNGWFRDYLWFNSAPLVNGYNAFGGNDLSVLSWIFLAAHLCWATGFMFLISWRGYWQELIDIILVMHLKTPILYDLWNGGIYTPLALSIVQARFIGLAHFSAGFIFTYAAFVVGATT
jgi:photosystem I P700 chlorophyll a apoprotein A2